MAILVGSSLEGGIVDFASQNHTAAWNFVAVNSGIADTFWIAPGEDNEDHSIAVGVYQDSGGLPDSLLGVVGPFSIPAGVGPHSFDISGLGLSIEIGITYHLALRDTTSNFNFNGSPESFTYYEKNADFPDPFGAGAFGNARLAVWIEDLELVPQIIRPDGDLATTGWSTAPLWSKINEETPDGIVISAVAS